jgi:tetratricopeptide (TPR) repeat protein
MKKLILVSIVIVFPLLCFPQITDTIFYTIQWKPTIIEDSIVFYRIVKTDLKGKPIGKVRDYYKNGKLQWEGKFLSLDPEVRQGKATWFYENGKKSQECFYSNGVLVGKQYLWYKDGTLLRVQHYVNGISIAQTIIDKKLYNFNPDSIKIAISYFERLLNLSLKLDSKTALLFDDWGSYHITNEDYKNAINFYLIAVKLKKQLNQQFSLSKTYCGMAEAYYKCNALDSAKKYLDLAVLIQKEVLGKTNPDYLTNLESLKELEQIIQTKRNEKVREIEMTYQLFDFYRVLGNLEETKKYGTKLQQQIEKGFEDTDTLKAIIYRELAVVYCSIGVKDTAMLFAVKSDSLVKISFGKDSPFEMPTELSVIYLEANTYYQEHDYEKAIASILKARKVVENKFGKKHKNYAACLNNLALMYYELGNYAKADTLYNEAITIDKIVFGTEHPNYTIDLSSLAKVYSKIGKYAQAETLFFEVLLIDKKLQGQDHPNYADDLSGLANLYLEMGKYLKAEPLYLKALAIDKKAFGVDHLTYAISLSNLASLYKRMRDYAKAEQLNIESLTILKKVLGENSPDYANSLNNLAELYYEMGNYTKAELMYLEANSIYGKMLGVYHISYSTSLNNLATLYVKMGNYKKAEQLFIDALAICKEKLGNNNSTYAHYIYDLAEIYASKGNYLDAEQLYNEALAIYKKAYGFNHPDYANCLNSLAVLYIEMGNPTKAEPLYIESITIIKEVLGESHPSYALYMNNLASFYVSMANYSKADSLCFIALDNIKKTLGENNSNYASSLNTMADLYYEMGNYKKAEPLYIEATAILKKTLGEYHPSYASSLNALANLYSSMANYPKADSLYYEALSIQKKALGINDPTYATSLINLAELYKKKGNFLKAESLLIEAVSIFKKTLGVNHPIYAASLDGMAGLYNLMGNYKKAELLFTEALTIRKKVLGENHPSYAESLDNLAGLYEDMGEYDKAKPLFIQALTIRNIALGENHQDYAASLNNLALFYTTLGQYGKAEPFLIEAVSISKKKLGENHPDYARAINNLALITYLLGDYSKAESLFLETISILKNVNSVNHPDYVRAVNSLAILYGHNNEFEKAEELIIEANNILNIRLAESAKFMSENEREKYLKGEISNSYDLYQSYFLRTQKDKGELTKFAYNNILNFKGQLLKSAIAIRKTIIQGNDTSLISTFNKMNILGNLLAKQYSLPFANRLTNIAEIEEQVNKLEKEVTLKSQDYRSLESLWKAKWQDVQNSLNQNDAVIEFTQFHYLNFKGWTDSILYYALILKKGMPQPESIYLFEEKQLLELINKYKEVNKIDFNWVTELYLDKQLYKLLWQPLDSILRGINTIYYSPSGLLNKIAISAIPVNERLLDKYKFFVLGSTGELTQTRDEMINYNDVAIFGGVQFEVDSLKIKQAIEKAKYESLLVTMGGKDNARWEYMGSSKEEANTLNNIFQRKNISVKLYLDTLATEESFKNLGNKSPEIIHISTHGFYNPLPKEDQRKKLELMNDFTSHDVYNLSENPLMRTGLIFAGANYVWMGNSPVPGRDDGILTAYEISNLNLFNTKLVVTSACETALGDIQGGEGVFGLQRGFKMAGADNIIITLWQVSAEQTKEFMISFYSKLLGGQSIHKAFYETQTEMKTIYPNPYYWAAFVLLE